jgi:hypothetical protein
MTRGAMSEDQKRRARAQLTVVGEDEVFSSAPRLVSLLEYLVEAVLEGAGAELNQARIAIDVMGRNESFDPSTDSSVRVEAGRLRARLREYYGGPGAQDEIRFEMPKGRYNPPLCQGSCRL